MARRLASMLTHATTGTLSALIYDMNEKCAMTKN